MNNLDAINDQLDEVKNQVIVKFKNLAIVAAIDEELRNSDGTSDTNEKNKIREEVAKSVDALQVTADNFKNWLAIISGARGSLQFKSFVSRIQELPDQLTEHIYSEIQKACRELKSELYYRKSYIADVRVERSGRRDDPFKSVPVIEEKWGDSDDNKIIRVEANEKVTTAPATSGQFFTTTTEIREWISTADPDVVDIKILSDENQTNASWISVKS